MSRIVIFIGSLERGGTELHLLRTLPGLRADGLAVEVFVLSGRGVFVDAMREAGVPVVTPAIARFLPARRGGIARFLLLAGLAPELTWRLLWRRPSIVHFYLPESYCLAGPIAVLMGIRTKLMSRRSLNAYHASKPSILARLERWLHRRMTAVLGNSERVVAQLSADEDVPREKLVLLRNGVAVNALPADGRRAQIRTELLIEPSCVALVIVANLIPYKGHLDLLEALALLPAERDWNVLVLGVDAVGHRSMLERRAEALGIADRVRFLGETEDVGRVLDGCDIGVLCSHEEGFSNALLEYMERALPVVATAVGGNTEAVVDGETGLLVPPRQPRGLAEALEKLIADAELRRRLGAAGRDRAMRRFSQDASVEAYARLYRSLLQDGSVPADLLSSEASPNWEKSEVS